MSFDSVCHRQDRRYAVIFLGGGAATSWARAGGVWVDGFFRIERVACIRAKEASRLVSDTKGETASLIFS